MTSFDDLFQETALPMLMEQFGESFEYHPREGRPRTITGIVTRFQLQPVPGVNSAGKSLEIVCYDDGVRGIQQDEINTGGDRVKIAWRKGTTPEMLNITKILADTAGVKFEARG